MENAARALLHGGEIPLYTFAKPNDNITRRSPPNDEHRNSYFIDSLFQQWEARRHKGLFHHDITACDRKIIDGEWGFTAQLIQGRDLKKRPTEFSLDKVLQPFDANKFNFTKIAQDEVLFMFKEKESNGSSYTPNAPVHASGTPNIVAINVSPIGYGHVLLIPRVLDCLPQRIDPESFLLALCMAKEAANGSFRVGYNSLGAFATINHLHFQAYYYESPFPVEKASTERIAILGNGVVISQLLGYSVRGLVFQGGKRLQDLSNSVSRACVFLQDGNKPYNILISESGKRIFLFLQCFAEKRSRGEVSQDILDTQVNPAVWEVSGYLVLKRKEDYQKASEESIKGLFEVVSLSEEQFKEVQGCILEALGNGDG